MRMRRKKRLEERLEACSSLILKINREDLNINNAITKQQIFNSKEIFNNDNPVHLEIGCGKGQFIYEIAQLNPNINYVAVEKTQNVIVTALEKIIESDIKNIRFIDCEAEYLENYFPPASIEKLYLNFSCPFPKNRDAKHRLTHENYLKIYKKILKPGSEIHMKTDNTSFFEFTINSLSGFGYTLKNVTLDLHKSGFEGNIITEYEKRFSDMGCPIYRLEAVFPIK